MQEQEVKELQNEIDSCQRDFNIPKQRSPNKLNINPFQEMSQSAQAEDKMHNSTVNRSYQSSALNQSKDLGNTTTASHVASHVSKSVSNAMKALQEKSSRVEEHNMELQNKLNSLQKQCDSLQLKLDQENRGQEKQFDEIERTQKEQLKLVEQEKSKHMEANVVDREKFENVINDLKNKFENKHEALQIEIKAKIQDNRILAEELQKIKEQKAESESRLDFQTKSQDKLEEENRWNHKELEKVKLEYSTYRNSKDKKCNDLEINNEKLMKENEMFKKENTNYKNKNDSLTREIKKLEENKAKVSKFVNEVVSINEALVNKINLLQDKERSRLKEKDVKLKSLTRNASPGMSTPSKSNHNASPSRKKSNYVQEELDIHKKQDKTNTHFNKYNNRALNINVITKEVEKQKKYADNQLKKTPKSSSSRRDLVYNDKPGNQPKLGKRSNSNLNLQSTPTKNNGSMSNRSDQNSDQRRKMNRLMNDEKEVQEVHAEVAKSIDHIKSMPKVTDIHNFSLEDLTDEIVKTERELSSKNYHQRQKLTSAQNTKGEKLQELRNDIEKVSKDIDLQSEQLLKLKQRQHELIRQNMKN